MYNKSKGGFRGGVNRGGNDRGPKRPSFGDRGERKMFSAMCDKCGNKCEVPFQPTGEKPVYCSNCFGDKKPSFGADRSGRRDDRRDSRSFDSRDHGRIDSRPDRSPAFDPLAQQLTSINAKLDKLVQLLNSQTAPKEVVENKPKKQADPEGLKKAIETAMAEKEPKKAAAKKDTKKAAPKKKAEKKATKKVAAKKTTKKKTK